MRRIQPQRGTERKRLRRNVRLLTCTDDAAGKVRFWPKAGHELVQRPCPLLGGYSGHDRCGMSAFAVAIGGKADMACCSAYVRF